MVVGTGILSLCGMRRTRSLPQMVVVDWVLSLLNRCCLMHALGNGVLCPGGLKRFPVKTDSKVLPRIP